MSSATESSAKPTELTSGTWNVDPAHSVVGFSVRHLMISKVRGTFTGVSGSVVVADDVASTTLDVTIDPASISTGDANRDGHLKNADFLNVEQFPAITFKSTTVNGAPGGYQLVGDLSMHGVTKPVTLDI